MMLYEKRDGIERKRLNHKEYTDCYNIIRINNEVKLCHNSQREISLVKVDHLAS